MIEKELARPPRKIVIKRFPVLGFFFVLGVAIVGSASLLWYVYNRGTPIEKSADDLPSVRRQREQDRIVRFQMEKMNQKVEAEERERRAYAHLLEIGRGSYDCFVCNATGLEIDEDGKVKRTCPCCQGLRNHVRNGLSREERIQEELYRTAPFVDKR